MDVDVGVSDVDGVSVDIRSDINNRHGGKCASTSDTTCFIGSTQGFSITDHTLRHEFAVNSKATDPGIDIDELVEINDTLVQSDQSVLNADIVERIAREACLRILPE